MVTVSCMGSRERYGLPVALHTLGMLDALHTDIYMPAWVSRFAGVQSLPSPIRALLGRNHRELPYSKVHSQYLLGLNFRVQVRRAKTLRERQNLLLRYGALYSSGVAKKMRGDGKFVGFTGESLEAFRSCKERGGTVVLDQVDPGLYAWERVAEEFSKHSDWEYGNTDARWSKEFEVTVRNELELADQIVVNSAYSKNAISSWVGSRPISILPIASPIARRARDSINSESRLRVLFLGALCLQKGVHIALSAVDRLVASEIGVELVLAGELLIRPEKLAGFRGARYIGSVSSSEVPALIDSCDVLVFPTLSDGFGMVQIEAMSRGMPVIATQNCAEVVVDGESGFVVEAGNVDALFERIRQYCDDRDLLLRHSGGAYRRSERYSVAEYRETVKDFFSATNG